MADKKIRLSKSSIFKFEWKIPSIISILKEDGDSIYSSKYEFCDGLWSINIFREKNSIGCRLFKTSNFESHIKTAEIRKSIQIHDGNISFHLPEQNVWVSEFDDGDTTSAFSWMDIRQTDSLKITCKITCFDCKDELLNEEDEKSRMEIEKEYPEEGKELLCPSRDDKLQEDMKRLFTSGEDSDVIIKVKDREFRAHRNIIRVSSPKLFNMLSHNVTGKNNGTIDINDCDPAAFHHFLLYLYSRQLDGVPGNIVFDLYNIGGKFGMEELKKHCVMFMYDYLSVETICDIITFSLAHNEAALLETASKFFVGNVRGITATDQWISFLKKHPKIGNDLYILSRYHTVMLPNARKDND